jgi:hypothetical protein
MQFHILQLPTRRPSMMASVAKFLWRHMRPLNVGFCNGLRVGVRIGLCAVKDTLPV